MNIAAIHAAISARLNDLSANVLPPEKYELTLVARYVGATPLDADIVLTSEELKSLEKVRQVILRFEKGNAVPVSGESAHPVL